MLTSTQERAVCDTFGALVPSETEQSPRAAGILAIRYVVGCPEDWAGNTGRQPACNGFERCVVKLSSFKLAAFIISMVDSV